MLLKVSNSINGPTEIYQECVMMVSSMIINLHVFTLKSRGKKKAMLIKAASCSYSARVL